MRKSKRVLVMAIALCLCLAVALAGVVAGQEEPTYFDLATGSFMGPTNVRFYEHSGAGVTTSESIRYLAIYVLDQAEDDASLIAGGNWTANTTQFNGALVMGWTSSYGPWADKAAYVARNMSACSVAPDYFFVAWGLLGNNYTGWSRNKPFMTLSGAGLSADWTEEDVTGIGNVFMRGRIRWNNDGPVRFVTTTGLQMMRVDAGNVDAPHWSAWARSSVLGYDSTASTCWECLLGDENWICDWIYDHFGVWICHEEQL